MRHANHYKKYQRPEKRNLSLNQIEDLAKFVKANPRMTYEEIGAVWKIKATMVAKYLHEANGLFDGSMWRPKYKEHNPGWNFQDQDVRFA